MLLWPEIFGDWFDICEGARHQEHLHQVSSDDLSVDWSESAQGGRERRSAALTGRGEAG